MVSRLLPPSPPSSSVSPGTFWVFREGFCRGFLVTLLLILMDLIPATEPNPLHISSPGQSVQFTIDLLLLCRHTVCLSFIFSFVWSKIHHRCFRRHLNLDRMQNLHAVRRVVFQEHEWIESMRCPKTWKCVVVWLNLSETKCFSYYNFFHTHNLKRKMFFYKLYNLIPLRVVDLFHWLSAL